MLFDTKLSIHRVSVIQMFVNQIFVNRIFVNAFLDGKAKIQLQIVMHDGASTTFQFVNPSGAPAQVRQTCLGVNFIKALTLAFFIGKKKPIKMFWSLKRHFFGNKY